MNFVNSSKHRVSVLIIDPDEHFTISLGKVLQKAGFRTQCAANIQDAFRALARQKFHIVLSEFYFSSQTALALLQYIRDRQLSCDVIIMTAYYDEKLNELCCKAGAITCIPKPVKKNFLLNILQKVSPKKERS